MRKEKKSEEGRKAERKKGRRGIKEGRRGMKEREKESTKGRKIDIQEEINICMHTYTYIHVYTSVCLHVCIMHVCVYVAMYVYACV